MRHNARDKMTTAAMLFAVRDDCDQSLPEVSLVKAVDCNSGLKWDNFFFSFLVLVETLCQSSDRKSFTLPRVFYPNFNFSTRNMSKK